MYKVPRSALYSGTGGGWTYIAIGWQPTELPGLQMEYSPPPHVSIGQAFGLLPFLAALAAVVVKRNGQRQVSSSGLAPSEPIGMDFWDIFTDGHRPSASDRRTNGSSARKSAKFRRCSTGSRPMLCASILTGHG